MRKKCKFSKVRSYSTHGHGRREIQDNIKFQSGADGTKRQVTDLKNDGDGKNDSIFTIMTSWSFVSCNVLLCLSWFFCAFSSLLLSALESEQQKHEEMYNFPLADYWIEPFDICALLAIAYNYRIFFVASNERKNTSSRKYFLYLL